MAIDEGRASRGGIPVPIQCIRMQCFYNPRPPQQHYHDYTELLFGIEGVAQVHTGSTTCQLSGGDLLLIHPHEPHDVHAASEKCTYIVIKFLPEILLAGEQTYPTYGYTLLLTERSAGKQCLFTAKELCGSDLSARFAHLMEEWEGERFGYELSLRADITHIFLYILRSWQASGLPFAAGMTSGQGEMISRAVAYVRAHYAELTEQSTAAACGVSRTYFSRCFKRAMRTSFTAYVSEVRLREAERLLLTTKKSVTEIAVEVGFSTASYFIDRFRALHGVTPHQYRQDCLPSPRPPQE